MTGAGRRLSLWVGVPEKHLYGAQLGAGFEHMRGETVPERMRRYMLLDTGLLGCLGRSRPNDLFCNRHIRPLVLHCTRKQTGLRLHLPPVQVDVAVQDGTSLTRRDSAGLPLQSGAYDLRLFRDGQLVAEAPATTDLANTRLSPPDLPSGAHGT